MENKHTLYLKYRNPSPAVLRILLISLGLYSSICLGMEKSILENGARNDGSDATAAIQTTLNEVAKAGGGTVRIPAGLFYSRALELHNQTTLLLENGAQLRFTSPDNKPAFLYGDNVRYVGIEGNGRIECSDPGKIYSPAIPLIQISNGQYVRIREVEIESGSKTAIQLAYCQLVWLEGISLGTNSDYNGANGLELISCQDVIATGLSVRSGGTGIQISGHADGNPTERIAIQQCRIQGRNCAIQIGPVSATDIRQVQISQNILHSSACLLSIWARDGGSIEHVQVSNTLGDNNCGRVLTMPIHIAGQYQEKSPLASIRHISIQDFQCQTQGRVFVVADKRFRLEDIQIRNLKMQYPWIENPQPYVKEAFSAFATSCSPEAWRQAASIVAENVKNLVLNHLQIDWPEAKIPEKWKQTLRFDQAYPAKEFRPEYLSPKATEFNVLWGRNLQGGYIWAPGVLSTKGTPGMDLKGGAGFTVR
jgi:hypothetical protein